MREKSRALTAAALAALSLIACFPASRARHAPGAARAAGDGGASAAAGGAAVPAAPAADPAERGPGAGFSALFGAGDPPGPSAAAKTEPRRTQAPVAQARAFGLAAPASPLFPEDFAIGPLQGSGGPRADERAALAAARAFLDGLLAGEYPEALVAEDRRALERAILEPFLSGDWPASYRLGALGFAKEDAAADGESAAAIATLSFFAATPGSRLGVEGAPAKPPIAALGARRQAEIGLRRVGGSWYVESLALEAPGPEAVAAPEAPVSPTSSGAPFEPRLRSP
ncbi:MAG: hypothetical protein JNG85_03180 [Spirochaetaceae bacterium]|nr:hypothetical protein [Spirochaetaceae bacterium]